LAVCLLAGGPAAAQVEEFEGTWVPEGERGRCGDDAAFTIADGALTFPGGQPWPVAREGLLLTVDPPADCTECEGTPFDIMPDGTLLRFVEGSVERFVNCAAAPAGDAGPGPSRPQPALVPETDRWEVRSTDDRSEAYFSTGSTVFAVGCRAEPRAAYLRYWPRPGYRFPEVATPRGPVNVLIRTVHSEFGPYVSPHAFDAAFDGARVVYERAWSPGDPFFRREEAFRLIAALKTGNRAAVLSPTAGTGGQPDYEDALPLAGSSAAIDEAMRQGGCAGFLAATGEAIREGRAR
jgi:hypothetical protein